MVRTDFFKERKKEEEEEERNRKNKKNKCARVTPRSVCEDLARIRFRNTRKIIFII
jgi:hypothetical protein